MRMLRTHACNTDKKEYIMIIIMKVYLIVCCVYTYIHTHINYERTAEHETSYARIITRRRL